MSKSMKKSIRWSHTLLKSVVNNLTPRIHSHDREKARRRRQIQKGMIPQDQILNQNV